MRVLLDTHVLLWALGEPDKLDLSTRALLADANNTVLFSVASIWEIAIKAGLKRADFGVHPTEVAAEALKMVLQSCRSTWKLWLQLWSNVLIFRVNLLERVLKLVDVR